MANEIRVNCSLTLRNAFQQFSNNPSSYIADMDGLAGPTPGGLLASKYGTVIDFSKLNHYGGVCVITNVDPTYTLLYGVYDLDGTVGDALLPFMLLPGEMVILRLSNVFGSEIGTGSGTASLGSGIGLIVKGEHGACQCKVEAFDP